MKRTEVTEMSGLAKRKKKRTWDESDKVLGQSKEWSTAALLGQMTLTEEQAKKIGEYLALPPEAVDCLQVVPYKGSLPTAVPTDPLIYRFSEVISVYGSTSKELIHEECGDGLMSAIEFKMVLQRYPNPMGDRVTSNMRGRFLPYKTY